MKKELWPAALCCVCVCVLRLVVIKSVRSRVACGRSQEECEATYRWRAASDSTRDEFCKDSLTKLNLKFKSSSIRNGRIWSDANPELTRFPDFTKTFVQKFFSWGIFSKDCFSFHIILHWCTALLSTRLWDSISTGSNVHFNLLFALLCDLTCQEQKVFEAAGKNTKSTHTFLLNKILSVFYSWF